MVDWKRDLWGSSLTRGKGMPFWLKQSKVTAYCNRTPCFYKVAVLFLLLVTSGFLGYFFLIQPILCELNNKRYHVKKTQEICYLADKVKHRFGVAMEKHTQLTLMFKKTKQTTPSLENTVRTILDIAQKNAISCYSVTPYIKKIKPLIPLYKISIKGSCDFHYFLAFLQDISQTITSITMPSICLTKNKKNNISFTLWVGVLNADFMDI